jgi:hypothetical protein
MPRNGVSFFCSAAALSGLCLAASGCRKPEPVTFTQWSEKATVSINPTSTQAKIVSIGEAVERAAISMAPLDKQGKPSNPLTARTTVFPKQQKDARKAIGNQRSALLASIHKGMTWSYQPVGLTNPPIYLRGIRLIGVSYLWDIEASLKNNDYVTAVNACVNAHKVGAALLNGGGYEASLGCFLIDESRKMLMKQLGQLSALQLGMLAQGVQNSWSFRPEMTSPILHEKSNMLFSLQEAQDFYESKKVSKLQEKIGVSAKDTIALLEGIEESPAKGKDVFDWIGNDIRARSEWLLKRVKTPKDAGVPPKLKDRRNWRLLYRYLATNLDSLAPRLQTTSARTQLFIIECYLRQKVKVKRPLPKDLKAFSKTSVRDPFTGEPFFYKADGFEFRIYSAGEDGIDNGGDTDTAYRSPDLTIEHL